MFGRLHCGPFLVSRLPFWPLLRLQSYKEARFIVGMLPLRPIYGWYVTIVARFKVAKL